MVERETLKLESVLVTQELAATNQQLHMAIWWHLCRCSTVVNLGACDQSCVNCGPPSVDHPAFISDHSDHHTCVTTASFWPAPKAWILPNIPSNTRIIKCHIPTMCMGIHTTHQQRCYGLCYEIETKYFYFRLEIEYLYHTTALKNRDHKGQGISLIFTRTRRNLHQRSDHHGS